MSSKYYVAFKSIQQIVLLHMSDAQLIKEHTCPVCHVRCGGAHSSRPRHAMIQHMYRKKKCDLEHAVWIAANYRKYFPVGRAKPVHSQPSLKDVETVISRHCGKQFLKHLKGGSTVGQNA
jgi:hypothetical protein